MQAKTNYGLQKKEITKHTKYNNDPNVIPLAIETMGAIGHEFKIIAEITMLWLWHANYIYTL